MMITQVGLKLLTVSLAVGVLIAASASFAINSSDCTTVPTPGDCLLPVVTSEQYATDDHDLVLDHTSGRILLRFGNAIGNRGDGALEVLGLRTGASPKTVDLNDNTMPAFQRIYRTDGSHQDVPAGRLIYHPEHHHFHFDGAVSYKLFDCGPVSANPVCSNADPVVAEASKVSFCLADVDVVDDTLPDHPTPPVYNSCVHNPYSNSLTMGVSVGWADNYPKDVAGQNFDVTQLMTLAPHLYKVVATVNPNGLLISGETPLTTSSFEIVIGVGVPVGNGIERPGV
jgi:lysyl oxidase